MKNLAIVLGIAFLLALTACGRVEEGADPSASLDRTRAAVGGSSPTASGPFAGAFFVGTFNFTMYGNAQTLTIDEQGNVSHSSCQAAWKITAINPRNTPDAMDFTVSSTQGYAECPAVGSHTCELKSVKDGAGNQIGISYKCNTQQQVTAYE